MNWMVFTDLTSLPTQFHWVLALVALAIGVVVLMRRKGTRSHVALGWAWIGTMLLVSLSALFVSNNTPEDALWLGFGFSYVHLLIPFTLTFVYVGVRSIRRGRVKAHRALMTITFFGSLVLAGALTFLPGRHMHTLFFGDEATVAQQLKDGVKK